MSSNSLLRISVDLDMTFYRVVNQLCTDSCIIRSGRRSKILSIGNFAAFDNPELLDSTGELVIGKSINPEIERIGSRVESRSSSADELPVEKEVPSGSIVYILCKSMTNDAVSNDGSSRFKIESRNARIVLPKLNDTRRHNGKVKSVVLVNI